MAGRRNNCSRHAPWQVRTKMRKHAALTVCAALMQLAHASHVRRLRKVAHRDDSHAISSNTVVVMGRSLSPMRSVVCACQKTVEPSLSSQSDTGNRLHRPKDLARGVKGGVRVSDMAALESPRLTRHLIRLIFYVCPYDDLDLGSHGSESQGRFALFGLLTLNNLPFMQTMPACTTYFSRPAKPGVGDAFCSN